jgi:CRISPR-associated protein Cmr1
VRREGNVFNKEHIKDKQRFNIILSFYNKSYKEEVLNSFYALIKFGSIGAKARNGFGSLNIKNIPNPSINVGNNLLGFTAFSKEIKLFMGNEKDKWEDALSEIGMVYKDAKLKLEDKHQWKNRSLVALPIDVKAIHPKQTKETLQGRHTKPYFLHINKLENGKYQGQILFLPYKHKDLHNYMNVHAEMCNYMKNNALQEVQL